MYYETLTNSVLDTYSQSAPLAVIHIGPFKTSSSRTQGILWNLRTELTAVNYYHPHYAAEDSKHAMDNSKGLSKFACALRDDKDEHTAPTIKYMANFLASSLQRNHNIILSSEAFVVLQLSQIMRLKEMLKGFSIRIVFVYRDVLSQMVSFHFERNRFEHEEIAFSSAFSAFLLKSMDNLSARLRPIEMLSNFSSVFGAENMRIIDLHGTTAAKKEIAHVILCQIAGVMCDRNRTDVGSNVFSNRAYNLIPAQVFSHFQAYVKNQNDGSCNFCGRRFDEYQYFEERYANETAMREPPANISTKLTLLLPYAQYIDTELREKYHDCILEGNREANLKRMAQVRVQELDEDAFLEDVYWDQWIHSEYQNALTGGRLCNCTEK